MDARSWSKKQLEEISKQRLTLSKIENLENKLKTVSVLDALVALPIVIKILEEIAAMMMSEIEQLIGQQLNKDKMKQKRNLNDIFKRANNLTIEEYFNEFIKAKQGKEMISTDFMSYLEQCVKSILVHFKIDKSLYSQAENKLKTALFIATAQLVYNRADDWQTSNLFSLAIKTAGYDRCRIESSFQYLRYTATQVEVTEKTKQSLEEVALWLQGMYCHIHNLAVPLVLKKLGKNNITIEEMKKQIVELRIAVDEEDESFLKYKGMTKYDIALLHLATSTALTKQIAQYKAPLKTEVLPPLSHQQENSNDTEELTFFEEGMEIIEIKRVEAPEKNKKVINEIEFGNILAEKEKLEDENKINSLRSAMLSYSLSEPQINRLQYIKPEIKGAMRQYLDAYLLIMPVNTPIANQVYNNISCTDEIHAMVEALFNARDQAKLAKSHRLLNALNQLLLLIYTDLLIYHKTKEMPSVGGSMTFYGKSPLPVSSTKFTTQLKS